MKIFPRNSYFKSLFLVTSLFFGLFSCTKKNDSTVFKSNFKDITQRTWIGPEYWANPMQDWQINTDRIECLVSNTNSSIHHLTRQLGTHNGTLEMQVSLGLLNTKKILNSKSWVGFSLGAQAEFNDNKTYTVFRNGLNIGVGTNGALFIGKTNKNNTNKTIIAALKEGVDLNIKVTPLNNTYKLDVSLYKLGTDKLLASISKNNIAAENLIGDLVLVSNFETENSTKKNYKKSVWFKDWTILGTKIVIKESQSFGPILFSQYTLVNKKLKLTAKVAPIGKTKNKMKLQVSTNNKWKTILEEHIDTLKRSATFRIEDWDITKDYQYRLVYNLEIANKKDKLCYWEGIIRKSPIETEYKNDF